MESAFIDKMRDEMASRASIRISEDGRVSVSDGCGKSYIMSKRVWDGILQVERLDYETLSSRAIKNLLPHALEKQKEHDEAAARMRAYDEQKK